MSDQPSYSNANAGRVDGDIKDFTDKEFLRPLFTHYREVRVSMQVVSIGIALLVSVTETWTAGKITPASIAVLCGIPLNTLLAWLIQKQREITQSFLKVFDVWVVIAALIFDIVACYALTQTNSLMFATCVAYLTVAWVLPQVSQREYAILFTVAHCGMVFFLFEFNAEKFVPFVINCLLLYVGNDRLARSLGFIAERQLQGNKELFVKAQGFIKSMLFGFCDAVVVMGPAWTLDEESSSLSTLLGRPAPKGKEFETFIDLGDREDFRKYMEMPNENHDDEGRPSSDIDSFSFKSVRFQTIRVHLYDAYNNAVAVHVCSASMQTIDGKPMHLVGISETSPLSAPKKAKVKVGGRARPTSYASLNMMNGKLEPTTTNWTPKQVSVHVTARSRTLLSKALYGSSVTSSIRKRRDSPVPQRTPPSRTGSSTDISTDSPLPRDYSSSRQRSLELDLGSGTAMDL